jgi:hypothetical protein
MLLLLQVEHPITKDIYRFSYRHPSVGTPRREAGPLAVLHEATQLIYPRECREAVRAHVHACCAHATSRSEAAAAQAWHAAHIHAVCQRGAIFTGVTPVPSTPLIQAHGTLCMAPLCAHITPADPCAAGCCCCTTTTTPSPPPPCPPVPPPQGTTYKGAFNLELVYSLNGGEPRSLSKK